MLRQPFAMGVPDLAFENPFWPGVLTLGKLGWLAIGEGHPGVTLVRRVAGPTRPP
ncbi:MAG: hypothetical protein WBA45_07250 [Microthrixaceae bacterium]